MENILRSDRKGLFIYSNYTIESMRSNRVSFLDKLFHWFLLDHGLFNAHVRSQESVIDLISRNLVLESMIEDVLGRGILLDGLNVSGNGNVEIRQLNRDGGQRLDHLCFVSSKASSIL